ncbi:50S ribosomal protein L11 methyltransferase [Myxococcota bacterium]|nr:50S ribosomal protein L11 methyltransferase [Myxococcota bacterium]
MEDLIRIEVRLRVGRDAEIANAEAFACGALGLEECDDTLDGWITSVLYAPSDRVAEIREALSRCGVQEDCVLSQETVPEVDWTERWKEGLQSTVVSPRLLVRPSFVASTAQEGQREIVIDPGQAFGTGGHASTLLALEWIDLLAERFSPRIRIRLLDVGTGTGVLALCAARVIGAQAVAFDLDGLCPKAARDNARANGLEDRLLLFTGSLDALRSSPFDLVVANLLSSELLPIIGSVARATRMGGTAVFSGLLAEECSRVETALASVGLPCVARRFRTDAAGVRWAGLLSHRRPARSSERTGG